MALSSLLRDAGRDAVVSWRLLARRPGFTALALLTLALGIGAPAAIFSVVRAVLLRPLPYADAHRVLQFRFESRGRAGHAVIDALPADMAGRWGQESATLAGIAVFNDTAMTLSTADGPHRLTGLAATANLFDVLKSAPALGSTFSAETRDRRQIVLSHATWRRFFGSSPSAVGSYATFDGTPHLIAGVMPEGFDFPDAETAFWLPIEMFSDGGRGMLLPAIGRMRAGATLDAVLREGSALMGVGEEGRVLLASSLQEQMVGGVRRVLLVLMAAVGLVFVICVVNIALLLLTRGAGREREFAIRLALGARRGRLVRQLFMEAGMLAVLGGLAGLALALLGLRLLLHIAPPDLPRLADVSLDMGVVGFTCGIVVVTSAVFGLLSAGRTLTLDPVRALGGTSESSLVPRGTPRRRLNVLAGAELALAVVLLVGAGLLLRSLVALVTVDQGFVERDALAFQISLPESRYPTPEARLAFHTRVLARLREVEGITHAGVITSMPNRQGSGRFDYGPVPLDPFDDPRIAEVRAASEEFLEAMGVPLLAGRTLRATDGPGSEPVIVISEALAALHFPDRDPIGRTLFSMSGNRTVVGVVGNVRSAQRRPFEAPAAYLPVRQDSGILRWFSTVTIVVRGPTAAARADAVRAAVIALDPQMPPYNVRTLADEVSSLVAGPRFSATVLGIFALIALVMASVGVYGVMSHTASLRTREIGLRIALGATRGQVMRLMLRDGVAVVAGGLAAGMLAAVWLARGLMGMLHEVTPADPLSIGAVAGALASIGMLAAYVPARRATRITALRALREE